MNLNKVDYIATELTNKDVEFLNKYFKIMKKFNLNGNAIILNLLNIKTLPKVDICFIFKTLDSLETIKKDITKEILNKINAKLIVVSFPKKTISGKKLDKKRLAWFNKLIEDYETFEVENEIFYLINKTKLY
jgi:16S rRNA (guanine(1405)-N(7))-methyltransferase